MFCATLDWMAPVRAAEEGWSVIVIWEAPERAAMREGREAPGRCGVRTGYEAGMDGWMDISIST